ncbi:hypothetical protein SKAU_G00211330 [Synaphobranchus kaupii]|uniref:Reverse transcriptase domain-containing protein n=1 Tax=Synaphobranchus kaupii TaxID=118154 RepID=A0A9Q1IUY5_SYNKA|nr:hypothetical protein SKAU_G00211330 [Synaphobranchus kaupii]
MTNYRPSHLSAEEGDPQLVEELNSFFARFETAPTVAATAHTNARYKVVPTEAATATPHTPTQSSIVLKEHEVRRTLKAVNPRKAAGPDGVPGRVLRDCADQLAGVLTKIFNQSLSQAIVPSCLKTSTIIPVPKKKNISCLNDYRPVALTPHPMKCFEKAVLPHIVAPLPPGLDPYQFAYRANRLVPKLLDLGLSHSTCLWIKDFLSDRPQRVRIGPHTSTTLSLSTGSPQGCVLSPLLYSLYTHHFSAAHPSNSIIKFADDTTVVGCISRGDETAYRDEVEQLQALQYHAHPD